ncbi:S8 family serine peptidase [Nitriliruptor alkaliphilus]|uniref:S8 family serine peptidase n=1 Tax=Nitriliruptor alkaliphilus TaxID=427918 RepID=UPI000695E0F5|nr:S8 family serine peptidase [Nitriliruptor alkaliphilus]
MRPLARYSTSSRRSLPRPVPVLGVVALIGPLLGGLTGTVTDTVDAVIDAGVLAEGRALVHVSEDADLAAVADQLAAAGTSIHSTYAAIDVVAVVGDPDALERVAGLDDVEWLERDAPVELLTDTSHTATRGAQLLDGEVTVGGQIVDGSGIGVAVVDSGVDELHPDFAGRIGENVKVLPGGVAIPLPISDTASFGGHGTHVAGTVVGTGAASGGTYRGAATGATVHSVSAGAFISLAFALDGLGWVLDNHDTVSPAIRVVNNSWGSSGEHNPNSAVTRMVNELVDAGVTVVFAAGNSGGDGSSLATSPECTNQTPGVICVAAADDLGQGSRDGGLASFSSRGVDGRPETYPDLSAPGANIVAPCAPTLPICLTGSFGAPNPIYYSSLSGTSMAAPHVAGIAAQVLQVAPDLTPAEVEALLVDTAYDRGLPAFADGAGHVDAVAAVLAATSG